MGNHKTLARRQFLQESAAFLGTGALLNEAELSRAASGMGTGAGGFD